MCSPTVGAGCDFNLEHFDVGIHLYVADNKSSAFSFTQGCFRVRKLKDKEIHVFLSKLTKEPRQVSNNHQLNKFTFNGDLPNVSPLFNLECHLEANSKAMKSAFQYVIISNLSKLGLIPQLH